ncbi:hypothetical protein ACK2FT_04950 [Clostridioides difficile]|nr:hypothetical protein [Clostridioides difficile]
MESKEKSILRATHFGIIKIGEKDLNCAVLENGSRIINKSTVFKAFGRTKRGRKKMKFVYLLSLIYQVLLMQRIYLIIFQMN